ncbi:MAG: PAS domain S-box protein [Bacteroidota bacterium]
MNKQRAQEDSEKVAKEYRDRFNLIAEHVQDIITIHNKDGSYAFVSASAKKVLGYSPQDVVGQSAEKILHSSYLNQYREELKMVNQGSKVNTEAYQAICKDGSLKWLESVPSPIFNDEGEVEYIINVSRDITERKTIEEKVIEIRHSLSQDFHDEVGSHLSTIKALAQMLRKKTGEDQKESEMLDRIIESTDSLIVGSRSFMWSIDPDNDLLDEIFNLISGYGEDFFHATDIDFYATSKVAGKHSFHLPFGWGRHIVMIFKEVFSNMLKHAECSEVYLELNIQDGKILISAQDNGKGITSRAGSGYGLKNLQERAKAVNASLNICKLAERGTTFQLAIDINDYFIR